MPNGGSDNCSECLYNKALHDFGFPDIGEEERFARNTYCTLRQQRIWGSPAYTYCANYAPYPMDADPNAKIKGPIYKLGLVVDRGHPRIPWFKDVEPLVGARIRCVICRTKSHRGIRLDLPDGTKIGFCSNEHYLDWIRQKDTSN